MQENNSSLKGNAPIPKPTKYRLACDSCQHSKIRCNQKRPTCRRCAKKGIECVYSPARRAGRPRTRNSSKNSSSIEDTASSSLNEYPAARTEHNFTIPASNWMSPFPQHGMMSASENSSTSCSCSCSNESTIFSMARPIQMPSSDDMDFSQYQQLDNNFQQRLPDLTDLRYETPKQINSYYIPMSSEIQIAPELLNLGFCGAPQGHAEQQQQQQQQQDVEHCQPISTAMFFDEGQPCFGLLTPEDHPPSHQPDQHQENTSIPTTSGKNMESCGFENSPRQQEQIRVLQLSDHIASSTTSCDCLSTLLDHISTPSQALPPSCLASTSAALSTSRLLITCCCATMACPNACCTRPSAALVICEAIDRALLSLKLGVTSLWTTIPAPNPSHKNGTSSSSSSPSSPSSTSGKNSNEVIPLSPVADEEHEPLRCGTLPIQGADRRAVLGVLLVKRALEMRGVLERLRDTLRSGLSVSGHAAVKKSLSALCADMVGEFTQKVAERVETVKLQMC